MKKNFVLFSMVFLVVASASALMNPAAVYCQSNGFEYRIEDTSEGVVGLCCLPDGSWVDEWSFLQGHEGVGYSFCAKQGLDYRVVSSYSKCSHLGLDECLVCVTGEGVEVEVTEYMNLSLSETVCGDGVCGVGEEGGCLKDCSLDVDEGGEQSGLGGLPMDTFYIILSTGFLVVAVLFILLQRRS